MGVIDTIKEMVSIDEVIGAYTPLKRSGQNFQAVHNPLREEATSSLHIYTDTQKYHDFGSGEHGDILDFIEKVENLDRKRAISFLQAKYLGGVDLSSSYQPPIKRKLIQQPKKDNEALIAAMEVKAKTILSNTLPGNREKYSIMDLDYMGTENRVVRVSQVFEKLFEGYLIPTEEKFAKYIFSHIVGYDSYYSCPAIIIRDESERVVNIVRYRPHRNGQPLMQGKKPMKYLYLKGEETPNNAYLFPLQAQMQKMMRSEGYCYIGEGLKNSVNASIMGIPFISIESASSIKPALIDFLKSDRMNGIELIGSFDGDKAGEAAYKRISREIHLIGNEFEFDSDVDFSEWLKEEKLCQLGTK